MGSTSDGRTNRATLRRAQQVTARVEAAVGSAARPLRNFGFPYRAPTVPRGVEVPPEASGLGAHYDTEWARRPLASSVRTVITEGPIRLAARLVTDPEILGTDRLADLTAMEHPPAVIFAPNHHSHFDTALMIRSVPAAWRHRMVVAAAADYFFDKRWKATISSLALNAIPIDREITGRKSSDMIRDLIDDGYSLVIYPGRSFAGRVGAGLQGRRRLPVGTDGRSGGAGVHRRHRGDLRQGHEAPEARPHQGRLRRPTVAARR